MNYLINIIWDNEYKVWIATSDDIPGLVLESDSYDVLINKIKYAIPELFELNNIQNNKINLIFITANAIMKQAGINIRF